LTSTELLLGPTFATQKVLQDMKLSLADIGVVEFHEAFAGNVLLCWDWAATFVCCTV
jgi:acetyl-CoA acetyltransferase